MARSTAATKLAKYRGMRDFAKTKEPSGAQPPASAGNSFVIQKHAARRLHYDFRLELDGVLLSWSVPKGPSLSPTEKRLAVRTEDHPLDYASFEGIIPQGQYGGGTVVVWDRGTWEPEGDPHAGMKKGHIAFTLHGEKLAGKWHLVRTKGRGTDKNENWLLFKSRDEASNENLDIVAVKPESVISGKTVEQVAAAPERVWQSNREPTLTVAQKRAQRIASAARTATAERQQVVRVRPARTTAELIELVAQLPLGFKLTSLDKVLYPDQGITKGQLIAYLAVVADWALPHIGDRPLTIVRCPEGRKKPCFFQKHILAGSPPPIHPLPITEESGEIVEYMRIHDMPGLVALAQLGTLEIHTWGSRADKPERPDVMVFDLDPDVGLGWEKVALAAFAMRRKMHDLGFESFLKTTGGKGLHVVVPVERRQDWNELKNFTKAVSESMEREEPSLYTTNMAKKARKGKIFLDYLRNGRNATFIAPYSPRARDGAPVAVPITWEELAHGIDPLALNTASVPRRLAMLTVDPWKDIYKVKQAITAATWKAVGGKP
ncbi:MAG: non-homologous end-joining DNA ligase [Myxococcota bacterium]|nr:non-homologous end-joining DNA ligase [Myxococcota bacterium]